MKVSTCKRCGFEWDHKDKPYAKLCSDCRSVSRVKGRSKPILLRQLAVQTTASRLVIAEAMPLLEMALLSNDWKHVQRALVTLQRADVSNNQIL